MMINELLKKDYQQCHQIILEHSKSFSLAFDQLPSPKKEAVWSLYAFNRMLDDAVDHNHDSSLLDHYYNRFINLENGIIYQDSVFRTLNDTMKYFKMKDESFLMMFEGQYLDLTFTTIKTDKELLRYCLLVAGSVGLMLLPIVATNKQDQLRESALSIGIAMQLTNILRDVKEDFDRGRIYFPEEKLIQFNVSIKDIEKGIVTRSYKQLVQYYIDLAHAYYDKGLELIDLYDKDSQFVVKGAALVYRAILDKIVDQNYRLDKRAVVSKIEKIKILRQLEVE